MISNKVFTSKAFWSNYIDSIIDSIQEDKDAIIDLLIYGRMTDGELIMKLSVDSLPAYQVKINKIAEKSPFGEEEDSE